MTSMIILANSVSLIFLLLTGILLFTSREKSRLSAREFVPLALLLILYVFIVSSNILEHSGISFFFDSTEDLVEILFPLLCLFFVSNWQTERSLETLREKESRLETALANVKEQEEKYRHLVETSNDGIIIAQDGFVTFFNTRAKEMLDRSAEELLSTPFQHFIHPEDQAMVRAYHLKRLKNEKGLPTTYTFRIVRKSGGELTVQINTSRIEWNKKAAILLFIRDITDQIRLEQSLRQSQKLESLGTLAGGIAHDFNNMLGGILGAAEMLGLYLKNNPQAQKFQEIILESSQRAADLTGKLLAFSHDNPPLSTPVNLHDVIEETVKLLKNTIDKRIEIIRALEAERSIIVGDPSSLQNTILNICINSSHAMPEGGTIYISSRNNYLDSPYCTASPFELEPQEYIEIEIRDTGSGIAPELLEKVFDPFFTTKEKGQGTGLGLASAYGTVKQHKGALSLYSEIDRGTAVHILLPLAYEGTVTRPKEQVLKKGSGVVLVVDDENVMRITAKAILENLGYEVIPAENGREALRIYKQQEKRIDLVLLDMVMPVMNGRDCFIQMQEYDPDVRVILSSGFSRKEDLEEMKLSGLKGFIRKPYRSSALSQSVYEALHH